MSRGALAWCPFPDEAEARAVAKQLLDERLIACANILPGMVSLYEWEGERCEANEVGVLFKTSADLSDRFAKRLSQLHSYASPAIMLWDVQAAPETTAEWLGGLNTGA